METLTKDNRVFLPEVVRLVREGHRVKILAKGYSMRPFVEDGRDMLVFDVPGTFTVGDVVLAEYAEGSYVCHRIVRMEGEVVTQIERKGKLYDLASSRCWRWYSTMWCSLLPIRRYLLAVYRHLWLKVERWSLRR